MLSVSIGPLSLSLTHALLLGALLAAVAVGAIVGRKEKIPVAGALADIFLVSVVVARVGFVIQYFDQYQNSLLSMIDIRDGGFSVPAGLAGALGLTAWKLLRNPASRRPLSIAVTSGLLIWGSLSLLIGLMESQSRNLPDVTLALLDETPITLAEAASGKPMVINLWASWCPPCIREMPTLAEAQRDNPNITFVFVNQGEHPETVQQFLTKYDLSLQNILIDTRGSLGRIAGSQSLPTTLFYNADGKQVNAHLGELSRASLAHNLKDFENTEDLKQ